MRGDLAHRTFTRFARMVSSGTMPEETMRKISGKYLGDDRARLVRPMSRALLGMRLESAYK